MKREIYKKLDEMPLVQRIERLEDMIVDFNVNANQNFSNLEEKYELTKLRITPTLLLIGM